MTDDQIKKLSLWLQNDGMRLSEITLTKKFGDILLRPAGTVVTEEKDVHFYMRCNCPKLQEPWILAIHFLKNREGYKVKSDIVEEESGKFWWESDTIQCYEKGEDATLYYMAGGLFAGLCEAVHKWKVEHVGAPHLSA